MKPSHIMQSLVSCACGAVVSTLYCHVEDQGEIYMKSFILLHCYLVKLRRSVL